MKTDNSPKVIDDKDENLENLDNNENTDIEKKGVLKELLAERKARQELKKELDAMRAERQKEQDEKLKEDGKLKELLDKKEQELATLKSELEAHKTKSTEWDNYQSSKRKTLIDKIPEADRLESFNTLPLSDLEKLADRFSTKHPLDVDSGNGKPPKPTELTEAEKEQAKRMGLSEDGFKLFKKRQEELKSSKQEKK